MNPPIADNAPGKLAQALYRPAPLPNSASSRRKADRAGKPQTFPDRLPIMSGHEFIDHPAERSGCVRHVGGKRPGSTPRSTATTSTSLARDGRRGVVDPLQTSHVSLTGRRLHERVDPSGKGSRAELVDRFDVEDPVAARLMEMLSHETAHGEPMTRLFVEQAVDLLRTQLLGMQPSSDALTAAPVRRGLASWQVKKVTAYMRERLEEKVSLNELAALVGLSRFHFCTAFRLATGYTPHEWLVAQRMEEALKLLADPALRITEIAFAVGYETPSSFAASFRKAVGVTPTEFRRQL